MRNRAFVCVYVLALIVSTGAFATDWPQFRGPNSDGKSTEKGINKNWNAKPPTLLWKVKMNDDGFPGPSVAGKMLFIIDHVEKQDVVRAIDVSTGKDIWQYAYDDVEAPNYGYSHSTPTIYKGKVYTIGRLGTVNCLDSKNGKLIWSKNLVNDFGGARPNWNYAASAVADGNNIVVCPGGAKGFAVALNKDTGRTIWQGGGTDLASYITPVKAVIHGKAQYVVAGATKVVGIDAADGKLLWSGDWKNKPSVGINCASQIVIGNSVFLATGYGYGCELLDIAADWSTNIRWQNKALKAHFSTPVLLAGMIYGVGDPDQLICLDPQTGETKWEQKGFEKGPVIFIDGVLLAFEGNKGGLVMIDPTPDGYKELGRFTPLGGQSWTAPIVSNKKLIVRNKAELACFDLK